MIALCKEWIVVASFSVLLQSWICIHVFARMVAVLFVLKVESFFFLGIVFFFFAAYLIQDWIVVFRLLLLLSDELTWWDVTMAAGPTGTVILTWWLLPI